MILMKMKLLLSLLLLASTLSSSLAKGGAFQSFLPSGFLHSLHLKLCIHQCLLQLPICLFTTLRTCIEMGTCKFLFFIFSLKTNLKFL
jgi:hypothetical protein